MFNIFCLEHFLVVYSAKSIVYKKKVYKNLTYNLIISILLDWYFWLDALLIWLDIILLIDLSTKNNIERFLIGQSSYNCNLYILFIEFNNCCFGIVEYLKINVEFGGIKPALAQAQPSKQIQGRSGSAPSDSLALPGTSLCNYMLFCCDYYICFMCFWSEFDLIWLWLPFDLFYCLIAPEDAQKGGVHNALVVAPAAHPRPYVHPYLSLLCPVLKRLEYGSWPLVPESN